MFPEEYRGALFFGDYSAGFIRTLRYTGGGADVQPFGHALAPVHFAEGPHGHVYYLSIFPGELRRIEYTSTRSIVVTSGAGSLTTDDTWIATSPAGGSCGPGCHTFGEGETVRLVPRQRADYAFAGWTGSADCLDGLVTVAAGLSCAAVFEPLTTTADRRVVDLSGNGLADVFLYNAATGAWTMAYNDRAGGFRLRSSSWSPRWTIAPAHLNADALIDFFLYDGASGLWFQARNNGAGEFVFTSGSFSAGWQVRATRLNLDATDDLLLYNPQTGVLLQCWVDGAGGFSAFSRVDLPAGWRVFAGDFTGDDLGDAFLYDAATGAWTLGENSPAGVFSFTTGAWSAGWDITVAQLDDDGRDDLFLHNPATGAWFQCLSAGRSFTYVSGRWSAGWRTFRGRLDADRLDDIFLYDPATGRWFMCLTLGGAGFAAYVSGEWSPGWDVALADLDEDADGLADVFLYNPATGRYFQCFNARGTGFARYTSGTLAPGYLLFAGR